mmetsp:Transcript_64726/g.107290  ORF Transcript_64726/g.107290 Transcript_64726/m.107290 type:complete len:230 (-) Transcript_64726:828-1517(-)
MHVFHSCKSVVPYISSCEQSPVTNSNTSAYVPRVSSVTVSLMDCINTCNSSSLLTSSAKLVWASPVTWVSVRMACSQFFFTTSNTTSSAPAVNTGSRIGKNSAAARGSTTNLHMLLMMQALFLLGSGCLSSIPLRSTGHSRANVAASTVLTKVVSSNLSNAIWVSVTGLAYALIRICIIGWMSGFVTTDLHTVLKVSMAAFRTSALVSCRQSLSFRITSGKHLPMYRGP